MNKLIDILAKASNGRFMTVTFVKKDGTLRTINGRTGVHFNGEASPVRYDANDQAYILMWSVRDRNFRRINLNTVERIASQGSVLFSA